MIRSRDFGSIACSHEDCKEMLSESNGFTDKLIDTNCARKVRLRYIYFQDCELIY